MKRTCTIALSIVLLATIICGCDRMESDWKKATESNTISAYEEFRKKYIQSPHEQEAEAKIANLEEDSHWAEANKLDTADSYYSFLKQYPNSQYANTARLLKIQKDAEYKHSAKEWAKESVFKNLTEDDIYSMILKRDMHYLYIAFLEIYPNSPHKSDVQQQLTKFRVERFSAKTSISKADMVSQLHFDQEERLYKWSKSLAVAKMGTAIVVAQGATSPENGFAITEFEGRVIFGDWCYGNIQILSPNEMIITNAGIEFREDTVIIFPAFK